MKSFSASDGSTINYRIIGKGKPIVFVHGWGVDHKIWFNKIESINGKWKKNHQRVYFDLPGMGASVGSKKIVDSDDMQKCIEEFLSAVVASKHYLLAGESYGGYLSRGLLIDHMEDIDGLFLLCPLIIPGYRQGKVAPRVVLEKDELFLEKLSPEERASFDYLSVVETPDTWKDFKKEIDISIIPQNKGFLEKQLDGSFSKDINAIAVQYDKPALILAGKQDSEVGYEDQFNLYKDFKRASIIILDKAGHNLQIDRKALFEASFLDWIERIETYENCEA